MVSSKKTNSVKRPQPSGECLPGGFFVVVGPVCSFCPSHRFPPSHLCPSRLTYAVSFPISPNLCRRTRRGDFPADHGSAIGGKIGVFAFQRTGDPLFPEKVGVRSPNRKNSVSSVRETQQNEQNAQITDRQSVGREGSIGCKPCGIPSMRQSFHIEKNRPYCVNWSILRLFGAPSTLAQHHLSVN